MRLHRRIKKFQRKQSKRLLRLVKVGWIYNLQKVFVHIKIVRRIRHIGKYRVAKEEYGWRKALKEGYKEFKRIFIGGKSTKEEKKVAKILAEKGLRGLRKYKEQLAKEHKK